jgi:carboxymethylenebutenolidase
MSLIKDETVRLSVSDTTTMSAFVARQPAGRRQRPGLLVFQEAFGVNPHIRDVTRRFAAEGYVAIAPEMYHRTAPGFEGTYGDLESAMGHLKALTVDGMQSDVRAAYDWLQADAGTDPDKIACVGFCMGGRVAFLANATVPVCAAISYYGGGIAPALLDRTDDLHAPILFYWGGLDKHIPPAQHRAVTDALTEAKKDFVNVEFSAADHGFFCDERPSFNPSAAAQSWALSLEFLRDNLK